MEASRRLACAPSASLTRALLSTVPTATASDPLRRTEVEIEGGLVSCDLKVLLHKMYYCYLIQAELNIGDIESNILKILQLGHLQSSLSELIIIHQITLDDGGKR